MAKVADLNACVRLVRAHIASGKSVKLVQYRDGRQTRVKAVDLQSGKVLSEGGLFSSVQVDVSLSHNNSGPAIEQALLAAGARYSR